jgi:hypothetical protein
MVVENFKNRDPAPVYRRFRDRERLAPAGLSYVSSRVNDTLDRYYQLIEAFWTFENRADVGILAAGCSRAITTQRGLNEGLREVNPIMRPFVTRGAPGEAFGSSLGFGAGVGAVYLFHRSRH